MRNGDKNEIDDFLKLAGKKASELVFNEPYKNIWMRTGGRTVSWIHLRLEEHPKYNNFADYKTPKSINEIEK